MKETYFDGRLTMTVGDITQQHVEAIVNAANGSLLGGLGVDGAIHRVGGPAILEACRSLRKNSFPDGLPDGEAVETTAGRLPAQWVIHTVGPVWHGGGSGEAEKLANCYRNSLELAARLGARTIAFPAISTGAYRFPREQAARIAWRTFSAFLPVHAQPSSILLVFFSSDDEHVFSRAVGDLA